MEPGAEHAPVVIPAPALVPASVLAPMSAATLTGALTPMAAATRTGASVLTRESRRRVTASPAAMCETRDAAVPADES